MYRLILVLLLLSVAGCGRSDKQEMQQAPAGQPAAVQAPETRSAESAASRLENVLARQSEDSQGRYPYRHPAETLAFFGIQPGMTVVEALPGRGWYSRILAPYLGPQGELIGADYALAMYSEFDFMTPESLKEKESWVEDWSDEANSDWSGENGAEVSAFVFGSLPGEYAGTADAVLFIRALHNLKRFEDKGGYLTAALQDAYAVLKPGGIVGVVQHRAPENMSDEWADGSRGYLKQDWVIQRMEDAGFEFVEASDINANPADRPGMDDIVWRLPPALATSGQNPELREEMLDIGESNRMTLKFRKP